MTNKRNYNGLFALMFIYLEFTIIVFLFKYINVIDNMFITFIYVEINYFCLFLGYISGKNKKFHNNEIVSTRKIDKLLLILSILNIIICYYNLMHYYTSLSQVLYFFRHPGEAYSYIKHIRNNDLLITHALDKYLGVIMNIASNVKVIVPLLLIYYWKNSSMLSKFSSIISIVFYIIYSFLIGAMINIGIIFMFIIPTMFIRLYRSNNKKLKTYITVISLITITLIIYFLGDRNYYVGDDKMMSGVVGIVDYLTQGYYGLSLSLKVNSNSFTGFQSIFRGLSTVLSPIFGIENKFSLSLLYRTEMEYGWPALQKWSTIFPWLASDISFLPIPFIFFVIGYLFRVVWKNCLFENYNVSSLMVLGILSILIFMIPANNQIFHTFSNAILTIFVIVQFIITKKTTRKNC